MLQGAHIELYTGDSILPQCHVDVIITSVVGQMTVEGGHAGQGCSELCQQRIRVSFSGSWKKGERSALCRELRTMMAQLNVCKSSGRC